MEPIDRGHPMPDTVFKRRAMSLRKVADRNLVTPGDRPRVAAFCGDLWNSGGARQNRVDHGGFSRAVASDQRDLLAAFELRGKLFDHFVIAVGFGKAVDLQGMPS